METDDVLFEDHETRMAIQQVEDLIRSENNISDTTGRGTRDREEGGGVEEDYNEAGPSSEQNRYGPRGRNDSRMLRTTGWGAD